jgi:hypothetical protein
MVSFGRLQMWVSGDQQSRRSAALWLSADLDARRRRRLAMQRVGRIPSWFAHAPQGAGCLASQLAGKAKIHSQQAGLGPTDWYKFRKAGIGAASPILTIADLGILHNDHNSD